MTSQHRLSAVKAAKVLVVGAGGIGCELLKTLALSGFQDIHIIDMDTIEVSNLNRQFLFRQSHVGQSKAKVASDAVLRFGPHISITPYHANVRDSDFNVDFFEQFNIVMNGLDNLDARRHVNRLCLAANVPLVESGTSGLLGQVTVHIKGKTECYECQPKPAPTTYPVCTITNTPSKFVHSIVWAKDILFAKVFGDNQHNDLNARSSEADNLEDVFERMKDEGIKHYGMRIYDRVFGHNIESALSNEEAWKNRNKPRPIYVKDVLSDELIWENGNVDKISATDDPSSVSAMATLGLKNPQDTWSLKENSRIFFEALRLFFSTRQKVEFHSFAFETSSIDKIPYYPPTQEIGNLSFNKDDQLAVEFVTAAANIRAASFGIPLHSLFDAKGIAGNIVHAVATTNAIIAGLIVIEAIKVLGNDTNNCRMTYCLEHPSRKMLLVPAVPFEPNKSCYVCSETPLSLEVNTHQAKLSDVLEKIVKSKLGMNFPLIMRGSGLLYEAGDDLEEDMVANYAANLEKVLSELPYAITGGTSITVEDLQQELVCNINIKHREEFDEAQEPDGMILNGWTQASAVENNKNVAANNGASKSTSIPEDTAEADKVTVAEAGIDTIHTEKKRKLSNISSSEIPVLFDITDNKRS